MWKRNIFSKCEGQWPNNFTKNIAISQVFFTHFADGNRFLDVFENRPIISWTFRVHGIYQRRLKGQIIHLTWSFFAEIVNNFYAFHDFLKKLHFRSLISPSYACGCQHRKARTQRDGFTIKVISIFALWGHQIEFVV